MDKHTDRETLRRFLAGSSPAAEVRHVVGHLLSGCDRCRQLAQDVLLEVRGAGITLDRKAADRLATLASVARKEMGQAPSLWTELAPLPPGRRLLLVRNAGRFRSLALVRRVIEESKSAAHHNPTEALDLARLALALIKLLPKTRYPRSLVDVARAEAWTRVANALRLAEDFSGAMDALDTADTFLEMGTGDVFAEADARSIRASVLIDIGRFEQASSIMRRVIRLYRDANETHLEGRALIKLAVSLRFYDPAQGVRVAKRAIELINPEDGYLYACAAFTIIDCLNQSGRHFEAFAEFKRYRGVLSSVESKRHRITIEFLAAQIAKGVGFPRESNRLLIQVIEAYRGEGMHQEMALASIELIISLVERRRFKLALRVATSAIQTLESINLRTDALAVWLYIREEISRNVIHVETLRRAGDVLRRFWRVEIPVDKRL